MVQDSIVLELVNTPLRQEVKWVFPSGTPEIGWDDKHCQTVG